MKNIIYTFEEIDYVLVNWPEDKCTPWVAAWRYNPETGNWCQGHYFQTKEDAMYYIGSLYREQFSAPNTDEEEIKEAEALFEKYAYIYDVWENDKGIVFAKCWDEAVKIVGAEYLIDKDYSVSKVSNVQSHVSITDLWQDKINLLVTR